MTNNGPVKWVGEKLKAKKKGEMTPELRDVLDDNVPVALTLLMLALIPVMVWLAEFKPF